MSASAALTIEPHQVLSALQLRNDLLDDLLDNPLSVVGTTGMSMAHRTKDEHGRDGSALTAHHDS